MLLQSFAPKPGDFLKEKLLMYDYIITGAGLYGAVIAAALTAAKAANLYKAF